VFNIIKSTLNRSLINHFMQSWNKLLHMFSPQKHFLDLKQVTQLMSASVFLSSTFPVPSCWKNLCMTWQVSTGLKTFPRAPFLSTVRILTVDIGCFFLGSRTEHPCSYCLPPYNPISKGSTYLVTAVGGK
jgi:hypothetical protein